MIVSRAFQNTEDMNRRRVQKAWQMEPGSMCRVHLKHDTTEMDLGKRVVRGVKKVSREEDGQRSRSSRICFR